MTPADLDNSAKNMVLNCLKSLASAGLIQFDEYGFSVTALEPGHIMSRLYIQFKTMQRITQVPKYATMVDVILLLASAEEVSHFFSNKFYQFIRNKFYQIMKTS
jgi:NAD(P)-dependent dehydrogenase (short-subunit alcohol dehydrogenase family)